ncbi:MAG: ABC transporter substrate-binding protein, partial [Pseudomonadota bacterium]
MKTSAYEPHPGSACGFLAPLLRRLGLGAAVLSGAVLNAGPASAEALACGEQPADASRIVVAGGSLVEILYDLEEESRIIAVDSTSNFPASARDLPQIGYVRNVSAEGLLSVEPSFVLGEHDTGPPEVLEQLENLGIDLLLVPEEFSVAGIRDKIRCVAAAIGRSEAGEELAARLLADLAPDIAQQIESGEA